MTDSFYVYFICRLIEWCIYTGTGGGCTCMNELVYICILYNSICLDVCINIYHKLPINPYTDTIQTQIAIVEIIICGSNFWKRMPFGKSSQELKARLEGWLTVKLCITVSHLAIISHSMASDFLETIKL